MKLTPGEPAPWFIAPTPSNPEFLFDSAAGRYVLMLFLPLEPEPRVAALRALAANQRLLDDQKLCCFVVVRDQETPRTVRDTRGLRWFLDLDGRISRLYGAVTEDGAYQSLWLLLDPTLRVMGLAALDQTPALFQRLAALPAPGDHAGAVLHAPVLVAPRVFEPDLCRHLIDLHGAGDAAFTGVMRDQGERTVLVMDELKKRRDILIRDPDLQAALRERLERRLFPMIKRGLNFQPTHIERYVVSCYDAADGGVFHPHRDNNTQATAHRKFACSLNLNDDFMGGDLRFAEFGPATYRPPVGGAVVFSCGLMHEATRVTEGRRYAFLPFFHDEAGAAVLAAYQARVGATAEPVA
jgi:2OG-Fe(II) oxygenase superfamily